MCLALKKVDTFGIAPKSVNFFQVKTRWTHYSLAERGVWVRDREAEGAGEVFYLEVVAVEEFAVDADVEGMVAFDEQMLGAAVGDDVL